MFLPQIPSSLFQCDAQILLFVSTFSGLEANADSLVYFMLIKQNIQWHSICRGQNSFLLVLEARQSKIKAAAGVA